MKKNLIYIFWAVGLIMLASCEKDEIMATLTAEPEAASITSLSNGFSQVITQETFGETIDIEWTPADYGVNSPVTYVVELDSMGNGFADPIILATTIENKISISLEELNNKLLQELQLPGDVESSLELRVLSSLREQHQEISSVINLKVTPVKLFDAANPPSLWVPGGYQGWSPGTAPQIYGISAAEFEGYVFIQEGTGFKFTSHPDWDHINYGDSGTPGKLTTDGLANGMSAHESGYYKFKVNIVDLTYEMYRVESFGLIGTATPGSWDNSTPMDYNATSGVWSKSIDLAAGALKFRANNSWDVNYGPENSASLNGKLIQTDDAINITEPGNYTVTLDFRRAQVPRQYKYTVVKNETVPTPAKLWIPGGYQTSGGDPSQADALTLYAVDGSNDKIYEGYVNIPSGTWIKFTSAPDWGHINYGFASAGALSTDGAAAAIDVPVAGYYKMVVNIENLSYSITKIESWGLIGNATSGGWDNSTPMTYDAASKTWSATADLTNGAVKFRANNNWDINYGPADSNSFDGTLIGTDAAVSINEPGNYTITIDVSRSQAPYTYKYLVVKN
jgi:hypothetical protein